jgi:hypothetical protein
MKASEVSGASEVWRVSKALTEKILTEKALTDEEIPACVRG